MVHTALTSHSIFLKHRVGRILMSDYRFATVKKQNKTTTTTKTILSNDKFLSAFHIQCHSRLQIYLPFG